MARLLTVTNNFRHILHNPGGIAGVQVGTTKRRSNPPDDAPHHGQLREVERVCREIRQIREPTSRESFGFGLDGVRIEITDTGHSVTASAVIRSRSNGVSEDGFATPWL